MRCWSQRTLRTARRPDQPPVETQHPASLTRAGPLLQVILTGTCLLFAAQVIWAAPARRPLCQALPTVPVHATARPPQSPIEPTIASSTVPSEESGGVDNSIVLPLDATPEKFVAPIPFRTPAHGDSSSLSKAQEAVRANTISVQESFARVFPVWCLPPMVGLILIVAGLDLRARSRERSE